MTYEHALEYLASLNTYGINLGLTRIEKLLERMGNPERRFKAVHVTGTNGKGSTAAMLAAILQKTGIKTALYTSPHLVDYTERMVVDGQPISRQAFAGAIEYTSALVAELVASGSEHPTEFEVLTAAAFHYFAAVEVEFAVIEVGLGGLFDSTNVVIPEVAVITNVTLEHTDRCGNSVAAIAWHKAGIIKQNVPVVTAATGKALAVIRAAAYDKTAPLYTINKDFTGEVTSIKGYRQEVVIANRRYGYVDRFMLNLLGRHQAENSALAVTAALILADRETRITSAAIRAGIGKTHWPGRFELIAGRPAVVIDGAHNPAGAQALRNTLDEVLPGKGVTFLLGVLADKDVDGIVGALVRMADDAVVVRPLSDRAADPATVAEKLKARRIETATSIDEGYKNACRLAGPEGVVCVAGSLYLIGPAREVIYEGTNSSATLPQTQRGNRR